MSEETIAEDAEPVDEIQSALDRGFEPGPWWKITDKEGNTIEITRSPKEVLFFKSIDPKDVGIFREYVRTEVEWVRETAR